ncbi:hypothetical protein XCCB100_3099 [Xanthomonas campestris pv. campestris]|uniref:Uncharacterized protein n=1 Tax=Xanthomonas campestris pv. campestris (strain B100) TaxID=509169 RepID=B0RX98_XANCB|nr:hypothetical protein XCCB100_3099 [Xanthomonas campestris pv. campestris]
MNQRPIIASWTAEFSYTFYKITEKTALGSVK